jgi:hypothetical protein
VFQSKGHPAVHPKAPQIVPLLKIESISLAASAESFLEIASCKLLDTCVSLFKSLIFHNPSLSASVSMYFLKFFLTLSNHSFKAQALTSPALV